MNPTPQQFGQYWTSILWSDVSHLSCYCMMLHWAGVMMASLQDHIMEDTPKYIITDQSRCHDGFTPRPYHGGHLKIHHNRPGYLDHYGPLCLPINLVLFTVLSVEHHIICYIKCLHFSWGRMNSWKFDVVQRDIGDSLFFQWWKNQVNCFSGCEEKNI